MHSKKSRFTVMLGLMAILGAFLFWTFSFTFSSQREIHLSSVEKLGSSAGGPGDEKRSEFNRLVEQANALKEKKLSQYIRLDFIDRFMSWVSLAVTSLITLIGAWTGMSTEARPSPKPEETAIGPPRNKVVWMIAVLAGLVTVVQGVAGKVKNDAKESKDAAIVLKEATDQAKKQFSKSGITPEEAADIIATLDKAILVAS